MKPLKPYRSHTRYQFFNNEGREVASVHPMAVRRTIRELWPWIREANILGHVWRVVDTKTDRTYETDEVMAILEKSGCGVAP